MDKQRRRLSVAAESSRSSSKRSSSKSRKRVEKVRKIEVEVVDRESLLGEDGGDTDRIMQMPL
jgi:hypothetical protein